jgi:hypothetical protein
MRAQLGNATVEDQAVCPCPNLNTLCTLLTSGPVNVVDTSTFTSNIHQQGYDGLLGLGPNSGSIIRKKVGKAIGNSFLYRFFSKNKASAYFITFFLDRKNDPGATATGQFTINEVLSSLSDITSMPKLDVDKVNRLLKAGKF